jgi:hypothetical protein
MGEGGEGETEEGGMEVGGTAPGAPAAGGGAATGADAVPAVSSAGTGNDGSGEGPAARARTLAVIAANAAAKGIQFLALMRLLSYATRATHAWRAHRRGP